ncbi:alpha-galactosidase [Metabacillus halosaccharovorans]|uniref:alpha-galactosidase n=1 Tax=Metabacillus halosaccharovorans TaxID=930124 RepID=UPI00203BDB3C|nr:alpha-galactosidase [Metabacillus halosaccharovorans]MCM3443644.1 alpha-galactosidase [Metabacillus halosaccharovorans]
MPILFQKKYQQFHIYNQNVSYLLGILPTGQLVHYYLGKKIQVNGSLNYEIDETYRVMHPYLPDQEKYMGMNFIPQELPVFGRGDFRPEAVRITKGDGNQLDHFTYISHEIREGKEMLEDMPCGRNLVNVESLIVKLKDFSSNIEIQMHYVLYGDLPLITRSVKVINQSEVAVKIDNLMSLSMDLPDYDYDMIQLDGAWARERHIHQMPLRMGHQSIDSNKGVSSAEHNPFIALLRKDTNEHQGEALAAALIYSGNFLANVHVSSFGTSRLQMGINPSTFSWKLLPGESFQSPEAVLVYSNQGLNAVSGALHDFVKEYLIHPNWQKELRPILYNNWEGTYMDFTESKLYDLAKEAKNLGVELFVLDDGWFGKRDDDKKSLGDWFINKKKFPQGLNKFVEKVNDLGMNFGIWIEPEMINIDSELYRHHPDWLIHHPDYKNSPSRNQFVLDFTRSEVIENIYKQLSDLLSQHNIKYVKWDMNRYISEPYSISLSSDSQGEFFHRYILGVYQLYERITNEFPDVLFESCSSGGARFDLGMLYYAPQTWTSDNTDAMERVKIQYGTSLVYPLVTMGAHVSASPNHQTERRTNLQTRGEVAFFGNFGYELDLMELSIEEKKQIQKQIEFYKKHRAIFQKGRFLRLLSPFSGNNACWQVISTDENEVIVGYYRYRKEVNQLPQRIKLKGLSAGEVYQCEDKLYTGDQLMEIGLIINTKQLAQNGGDNSSCLIFIYKLKK